MKNYWNKMRPFVTGILVFTFFVTVAVSSCNSKKSSEQTEKEQTEHPAGEEHPSNEEHPADSVKTGGDEHPASEEHPSN